MKRQLLIGMMALLLCICVLAACDAPAKDQTPTTFAVQYSLEDGSPVQEMRVEEGSSFSIPAPTRQGYDFGGFYTARDGMGEKIADENGNSLKPVTKDLSIHAYWIPHKYVLTFHTMLEGKEISPVTYNYGETVTLETLSKTGYTFKGWYLDKSFSGTPYFSIGLGEFGDKEFYACFEAKKYDILLEANGGTLEDTLSTVTYDAAYTLPVPKLQGYRFLGWFDAETEGEAYTDINGAALNPCKLTESKTLYAQWTLNTKQVAKSDSKFKIKDAIGALFDASASSTNGIRFSNWNFDYELMEEMGYKVRITVNAKIYCVDTCYANCKLTDGESQLGYSGDKHLKVEKGRTYDYSYSVDGLSVSAVSGDAVCVLFGLKENATALDLMNEYDVSDITVTVEFYK